MNNNNNKLTFDHGLWCAIETLTRCYEENAVKILVESSGFDRKKCLELAKETGMGVTNTMKVIDFEMKWKEKEIHA